MRTLFTVFILFLLSFNAYALTPEQINQRALQPTDRSVDQRPTLQLAILLDTSNSMDGLIHQARTQLWEIVNRLEQLSMDGQRPRLEIALFEYGNSGLSPRDGYIRLVSPFTSDLDRVSEKLFALRTRGGQEFAPEVTQKALNLLRWSTHRDSYRAIVVAGNETFHQGPVRIEPVAQRAVYQGVFINTIFCGNLQAGARLGWKEAAHLAKGEYRNIALDARDIYVEAPQDARIEELNRQLNTTYLAYGKEGRLAKQRQQAQDQAVAKASKEASIQRSLTKSGRAYNNQRWDLVDAYRAKSVDLEALEPSTLPPQLQGLSKAELQKTIENASEKRKQLQSEIRLLSEKRQRYLATHHEKTAQGLKNSLAPVFIKQALSLGFEKSP